MQAPRPRTLSADQRDQYDAALREQMKPYRQGAEKAFRVTLEQAKSAGVENEWTARARSSLVEFGGSSAPAPVAPSARPLQPAVAPAQPQPAVAPASDQQPQPPILVPPPTS
jgi:hypothetical protein